MTMLSTMKLSDLLELSIGGIWGEEAGKSEVDVSVVRVTELKAHGRIDPSTAAQRSVTQKQLLSRELRDGDLLLEKSGGGPNSPVGRVGYYFNDGTRTVCSNFMQLMRPNAQMVTPKYLFHFLDSFHSNGGTISMQTATTNIRNIKTPQYMDIQVPLPPLPEQQKIVEILEDHLSRLDAALADVKLAKEKAAQFRRSLLQAAFTGNLTSDGTRLMTKLPDGWVSKTISEIATFNRKKPQEKKNSEELVSFVPMPKVYETLNRITLDESISHMQGQKRSLTYFEDGDIIFAKITPCMENGKIAIAKFLLNGSAYGSTEFHVLTAGPEVLAEYLFYFIVSDDFRANAAAAMTGAVGQRRVPKSYLENHLIPLPPLPEQQKIVEILEDHLSRLDASVALADAMEKQSANLRRALLQAAFTGQLTKEVASV